MNAYFFRFSKRKNSTKQPAIADAAFTLNININDPNSSLLTPVIRVTAPAARQTAPRNIWNCNYCLISDLDRYYYISNWEYNSDGTWSGICDVDVLASWKSYIRASGGYVGRSYTYSDPFIPDAAYPAKNIFLTNQNSTTTGFLPNILNGSFIIGVLGYYSAPTVGPVTYFLVTPTEMGKLLSTLTQTEYTDWFVDNAQGTSTGFRIQDFIVSSTNPLQFIVSCKWFPYTISLTGTAQAIEVWGWNSGAVGIPLNQTYQYIPTPTYDSEWIRLQIPDVIGLDIASQPGSGNYLPITADNYPYYPPYAEYTLITPWGSFELDAGKISEEFILGNTPYLDYSFAVNLVSGDASFKCSIWDITGIHYELFRRQVTLAVDLPLAQMSVINMAELQQGIDTATSTGDAMVSAVMNMIGGTGQGLGSAISGIVRSITTAIDGAYSTELHTTSTTNTAFTPDISKITIQTKRYKRVFQAPSMIGKPYKKFVSSLNDSEHVFSGFVQMDYSNFDGPCTDTERDSIVAFLQDGVYIE